MRLEIQSVSITESTDEYLVVLKAGEKILESRFKVVYNNGVKGAQCEPEVFNSRSEPLDMTAGQIRAIVKAVCVFHNARIGGES